MRILFIIEKEKHEKYFINNNYFVYNKWLLFKNTSLNELKEKAEQGDKLSMAKLVLIYQKTDDYQNALKWLEEDALSGNEEAINELGNVYLNGLLGVNKDYNKAFGYYQKASDIGYTSESQRNRILKKIDALEESNNKEKLVRYLRVICKRYSKEYYLKTILSETYKTIGDKAGCLTYAKAAFEQEPNDPLVKYDYAVALMFNGLSEDALLQFEELVALGLDYIAFSEHGEGVRWAKKLLRNTQKQIDQIQANLQ